jgi:hypothetical protein
MSDKADETVLLEGPDGKPHMCEIGPIFDLDGRDYGLIVSRAGRKKSQETITTLLRVFEKDENSAIFRSIESDEEFDFVVALVRVAQFSARRTCPGCFPGFQENTKSLPILSGRSMLISFLMPTRVGSN